MVKNQKLIENVKKYFDGSRVVAGLGNIYVSEALWDSQIKPNRIGKNMSLNDCRNLVASIKKVLNKAIKFGGTTLKDFRQVGGEVGYFKNSCKFMERRSKHVCEGIVKYC